MVAGHGHQSFSAHAHMPGSTEQALACGLVCVHRQPNHKWAMIRYQHVPIWITHAADQLLRSGSVWDLLSSVCTKVDQSTGN